MALTDFLFNGQAPANVNTYTEQFSNLPAWYGDYTKGILAQSQGLTGNDLANQSYVYQGPRVASYAQPGMTGDQFQAQYTGDIAAGRQGVIDNAYSYQPALSQAQGMVGAAGAKTFPGSYQEYMSPYTDAVVNRIAQLGQRNLTESLLPAVNDNFINAGQLGSTRNADFTARAVRDSNESILGQQAQALEQGYSTAGTLFGQDQSRAIAAGNQLGGLAQMQQTLGLAGANAITGQGTAARAAAQQGLDTAYQDWQTQLKAPYDILQSGSTLASGIKLPTTTSTASNGPAQAYGASPLSQIASAYMLGNAIGG